MINLRRYDAIVRYLPADACPPPETRANDPSDGKLPPFLDYPEDDPAGHGWKVRVWKWIELLGEIFLLICYHYSYQNQ